jgi:hypothetical protein
MQKIIASTLVSLVVVIVLGAGCSTTPTKRTTPTPQGNVADPEITPDGYKFYIGSGKELCESKEAAEVCKAAGAEFFTNEKGCGCITKNVK